MRSQEPRLLFASVFGLLAFAAAAQAQTIGLNFTGATGSDFAPPDTDGAVGPNSIVEFVNGNFNVYNKTTSAALSTASDTAFWNSAGISSTITNAGLSDTRVIYDPSSQRWFASEITTANTGNRMLIARSNSSDPTAGWKAASYVASSSSTFADFDTLSVNASGVFLSTNNFNAAGNNAGTTLTSIPKSDLLLSAPSIAHRATFTLANNLILQTGFDVSAATTGYVVGASATSANQLVRYNLNNPGAAGATLSPVTNVTVQSAAIAPSFAYQPDGTQLLDDGDQRIGSAVAQSGKYMIVTHAVDDGTSFHRSGIRYTVLDITTNTVKSEGTILDVKGKTDYYYPSVAINASGKVVLGYNCSGNGAGQFAGSYARFGTLSDSGALTFTTSDFLLKAGTTNYHQFGGGSLERWGDYSTLVNDPSNPDVFWSFQEVALTRGAWSTQITQITLPTATPEPSGLLVVATGIPCLIALRRKRRTAI